MSTFTTCLICFLGLNFIASAQTPGSVDLAFRSGDRGYGFGFGFSDAPDNMILQPDGKVLAS